MLVLDVGSEGNANGLMSSGRFAGAGAVTALLPLLSGIPFMATVFIPFTIGPSVWATVFTPEVLAIRWPEFSMDDPGLEFFTAGSPLISRFLIRSGIWDDAGIFPDPSL